MSDNLPQPAEAEEVQLSNLREMNIDVIKFLVAGLGFGFTIFGYSYSHTYYRSFGISLSDLNMSAIDIIYRGIALLQDWKIAVSFCGMIVFSVLLLYLGEFLLKRLHKGILRFIFFSLAALALLIGALSGGYAYGTNHAQEVFAGNWGRRAYCIFKESEEYLPKELFEHLNSLTKNHQLKLIHLGKDIIHLAPAPHPEISPEDRKRTRGESYALPISMLRSCRIVGI